MWKFLGKTMASMVLTKEAREAAGGLAKSAVRTATHKMTGAPLPALPDLPALQPDAQQAAVAQMQAHAPSTISSERAELIRRALEVRRAKQTVLAELSEEDRERLVTTAMKAFLAEGDPKR